MPCYPPPGTEDFTVHVLSQDFGGRRVWEHALWNAKTEAWTRWIGERPTGDYAQNCNATYRWQLTADQMLELFNHLHRLRRDAGAGSASAGSCGGSGYSNRGFGGGGGSSHP